MKAFTQFTPKKLKRLTITHLLIGGIFTLTSIVTTFIPPSIYADDGKVSLDLQAKLFLNALSYYKNLETGSGSQFDAAIVYFPWSKESKEEGVTFSQILKGFKDKKINDRSFNVLLLTYNGGGGLREKITGRNVKVLFIFGEEESMIRDITRLTRSEKILSCISNAKFLTSGNVTMAVGLKENKPKIYFNLSSAQGEGADFGAKFLRIAEIVDEEINGTIGK
jgi:hypothetical protein